MKKLFTEEEHKNAKGNDKLKLQCCNCDKEFLKEKDYINKMIKRGRGKYCSVSCYAEAKTMPSSEVECKICKNMFSKKIYDKILCLPCTFDMTFKDIDKIIRLIHN